MMLTLASLKQKFARQSLTVKLVVTVSFFIGLIVMAGALMVMNITKKTIAETSVTTALYQVERLKNNLLETMFGKGNDRHHELEALLGKEKVPKQVEEINIFNDKGVVRFSSTPQKVGQTTVLSQNRLGHLHTGEDLIEFGDLNETGKLRIVHPIHGRSQCIACHIGSDGKLIGGIELFVPLAPIYSRFSVNRFLFLFVALAVIVLGAFVIRWLIHAIVKKPIHQLMRVMEKAGRGALDVRTQMFEDPELERLAKSFNSMVKSIEQAQKKIEEQHQNKLSQSNRLASLGQFISNVSHEIRNPLAAMSAAMHALRSEFQTEDGQAMYGELVAQIERIECTVNNLLRYARQEPLQFERVSVCDIIERALVWAEPIFTKNKIQTEWDCPKEADLIWGDPGRLEQVFLNLFINAASAMPEGGTLKIAGRLRETGEVFICVEDEGTGIEPEHLFRIFEPFFTTKKNGTGLGLSVVKGIMERHKGTIEIKSELGKGTKVFLCFACPEPVTVTKVTVTNVLAHNGSDCHLW